MATKWADYVINGVWKDSNGRITHVNLALDNGDTLEAGKKTSEADAIQLIKNGRTICTAVWNYTKGTWNKGADVGYVKENGQEYLRSHKDKTVTDNLDNLLLMSWL